MPQCASMRLLAHLLVVGSMIVGPAAARSVAGASRSLQQTRAICPSGQVTLADNTCGCQTGNYYSAAEQKCTRCPKDFFCKGVTVVNAALDAGREACPASLVTAGLRATSIRACVNPPGYSYFFDTTAGQPSASPCPSNSYSPGLKKQRTCLSCPSGFVTDSTAKTGIADCLVPAGSFLRGPGAVALCPIGTYRSGALAASNNAAITCLSCAAGFTTSAVGSTSPSNCIAVATGGVTPCPANYYCPDGTPASKVQCPNGLKTNGAGARSVNDCLTPPGFETKWSGGIGTTSACVNGYRADWVLPATGVDVLCTPCGDGVLATPDDAIQLDGVGGQWTQIAASSSACYIREGQGLYYNPLSKTWRAATCNSGTYGVAVDTAGLNANPCRDCPSGLTTSTTTSPSKNYLSSISGGFTSGAACVTKPGHGYSATEQRGVLCPAGTKDTPYSYQPCNAIPCDTGFQSVAGQDTCVVIPGWGTNTQGVFAQCPTGYWSAGGTATAQACTACPAGYTTAGPGSEQADCSLCAAGYGGASCTLCGGGSGTAATYGIGQLIGKDACTLCGAATAPSLFLYSGARIPFTPQPISRAGADSAGDCLNEFSEVGDGYVFGPYPAISSATTLDACINACKNDMTCMYMSFTYSGAVSGDGTSTTGSCQVGTYNSGTHLVAWKTGSAFNSAASKIKGAQNTTKAQGMLSAGAFTYWRSVDATFMYSLGDIVATANRVDLCLWECIKSSDCVGASMKPHTATSSSQTLTSCRLLLGNPSANRRGLIRAMPSRLNLDSVAVP